jgi:hypothetical protein
MYIYIIYDDEMSRVNLTRGLVEVTKANKKRADAPPHTLVDIAYIR